MVFALIRTRPSARHQC